MMGIEWLKPAVFFGSMMFALIGVLIFWLCFVIIDKLTPNGAAPSGNALQDGLSGVLGGLFGGKS